VARDAAHSAGALFVLNDRPDLARACDADGVHVGQDDAPPSLCRELLGDSRIVGFSTHAPAELRAALTEPVDYVSVGPVVPTPTKPGRPGTGLEYVRTATAECDLPFFVTGGISPDSIDAVAAAGARRFVVVRALTEAGSPEQAAAVTRDLVAGLSALALHPSE
jgi:thiamine-phosphate pyrophosphorylase